MANVTVGWEVEGIISTEKSVSAMLKVISTKTIKDTGKFFTWEGKVRQVHGCCQYVVKLTGNRSIHGSKPKVQKIF